MPQRDEILARHPGVYAVHPDHLEGLIRAMELRADVEIQALARNVTQGFLELAQESGNASQEVQVLASNLDDPARLADLDRSGVVSRRR